MRADNRHGADAWVNEWTRIADRLLPAPAPARRLAFPPADAGKREAENNDIGDENSWRLVSRNYDRPSNQPCDEDSEGGPALPGYGQAPAPSVTLGREPIADVILH